MWKLQRQRIPWLTQYLSLVYLLFPFESNASIKPHGRAVNKPRVKHEPHSAHGHAVNSK